MTLDPTILTAIGVLFTTATGALGWLVKTLWAERADAYAKLVEMLRLQYGDAAQRKQLWDDLSKVVDNQTREIADSKRVINDLVSELRRKSP
jgi:hypothetical protein